MDPNIEQTHDFSLTGLNGEIFNLAEILGNGYNVLLVFLRHLG